MEGLVLVTRGSYTECLHRFHIVIVDASGDVIFERGDKNFLTCLRSSAKPFQAITCLKTGIAKAYNLTDEECASLSGSLNGEPFQVEIVRSMLKKAELSEDYLQCGSMYPTHKNSAELLKKEGKEPKPIYHNCSAKHAGMLLASKLIGFPLDSYLEFDHPLQKLILKTVSEFCEISESEIKNVIDGCGAPVFFMPLKNLALGYKNLCISTDETVQSLINAVKKYPLMIAGNERLCTDLIKNTKGKVFAKIGADGVYSAFHSDLKQGLAIKIEDGSTKPLFVMFLTLLKERNWINDEEFQTLSKYWRINVKNSKNQVVGEYVAKF